MVIHVFGSGYHGDELGLSYSAIPMVICWLSVKKGQGIRVGNIT